MINCKSHSMSTLLPVALIFATCSFVSLAQELTCQGNGCDGCCVTSDSCSTEHTLASEDHQCHSSDSRPVASFETPLTPGLQYCPFNFFTLEYEECSNSHVDDRVKSVGEYGKPNWVGAEFQSIAYDAFSMTVMWEHRDAELLSFLPGLSPVQGYEIRIYEKEAGRSEVLRNCYCVTDPSLRNISDIRNVFFTYKDMSHMIVEVRTFPSLTGQDERNRRRNCSLLNGCSTTEDCLIDCYSWPQNCLNFLPSYNPETCSLPLYGPPVNVGAVMSLVSDSVTINGATRKLDLSWEPPEINYNLFPVPNLYYITIESAYGTIFQFKAVNTTSVTVTQLNTTSVYYVVSVRAYVPCSGLSQAVRAIWQGSAGCGLLNSINVVGICVPPTPPLHGWLGNYHSTSVYSTITFQCDSGWSPPELLTTTCTDQLEWIPDPANHTCSDIDECLEGTHNCSEYASCENTHGGFNCKCFKGYDGDGRICKFSSELIIIIGTSIVIGLVAAVALFLFVVASLCLTTRAKRIRKRVIIEQALETDGKIELDEMQNNSVLDATQTSLRSTDPPPKVIITSVNLSHGEFTGEGHSVKPSADSSEP